MLKKISFVIVLAFVATFISAQNWEVPSSVILKNQADYDYFNDDIIACQNYLTTTPFGQDKDKRKRAILFLLEWVSEHPSIKMEMNNAVSACCKKNPEMRSIYVGGWATYMLAHPDDLKDMHKGTLMGLRALIKAYQARLGAKKDKKIDELVKLDEQGKLQQWVADNIDNF